MTAELRGTQLQLKRTDNWTVFDEEPLRDAWSSITPRPRFSPRQARVELVRTAEDAPYQLDSVGVGGLRLKSDGTVGVRDGFATFDSSTVPDAPPWVRDIVAQSLAEAEQDRLGRPPVPRDHLGAKQRCEANARRGTGTGMCDRPLDAHGYCDRASDHIEEGR